MWWTPQTLTQVSRGPFHDVSHPAQGRLQLREFGFCAWEQSSERCEELYELCVRDPYCSEEQPTYPLHRNDSAAQFR